MRGRPNLYTSYASESRLFPTRTQQVGVGIAFILLLLMPFDLPVIDQIPLIRFLGDHSWIRIVNRMLIFTGNFSNKNNTKLISLEQKEELINNINNDIIYLSDNIILIRYQVFLPWLWKCRSNPIEQLDNLKVTKYYLQNKWNFSNE